MQRKTLAVINILLAIMRATEMDIQGKSDTLMCTNSKVSYGSDNTKNASGTDQSQYANNTGTKNEKNINSYVKDRWSVKDYYDHSN